MTLEQKLKDMRSRVNEELEDVLISQDSRDSRLVEAMRYCVLGGGKRIRPVLCLASYEAVGGVGDAAVPAAAALELIHAYSLVHDDLPCMDDDDVRRGRPSAHRAFGEGMAVLVGDALLTLAFELLAGVPEASAIEAERRLEVLKRIAQAAGIHGMIGGQVADLDAVANPCDSDLIDFVHERKTGALIAVAAWAGARLGTHDPAVLSAVADYGNRIGLAFQVIDDILDYGGPGERPEPASYPGCHGLEQARCKAETLTQEAKEALAPLATRAETLHEIADLLFARID